jgi:hypothetical protein
MSKMSISKSICSRKNILQGLVTIERIGTAKKPTFSTQLVLKL